MTTATQTTRRAARLIFQQCRICQEYEGCWGDCHGKEISPDPYLKTEDIATGLGPPSESPPSCFRLAENRGGDFDPATGGLVSLNHKPILQG